MLLSVVLRNLQTCRQVFVRVLFAHSRRHFLLDCHFSFFAHQHVGGKVRRGKLRLFECLHILCELLRQPVRHQIFMEHLGPDKVGALIHRLSF